MGFLGGTVGACLVGLNTKGWTDVCITGLGRRGSASLSSGPRCFATVIEARGVGPLLARQGMLFAVNTRVGTRITVRERAIGGGD